MRKKNKKRVVFIVLLILILIIVGIYTYFHFFKKNENVETESAVACILYMNSYMSFDSQGYVLNSSSVQPEDIPVIDGMNFDYVVVGERLPIENQDLFDLCLTISSALYETEIDMDKIQLTEDSEIEIYIGQVKVELGTKEKLDEKLIDLKKISSGLKNYKAGVLDMKVYNVKGEYTFTNQSVE